MYLTKSFYKTAFDYFKRNDIQLSLLAGAGSVGKNGKITVNRIVARNQSEKYVTILHELIHLDKGHHLQDWSKMDRKVEKALEDEIETLANYLYNYNPVLIDFLHNRVEGCGAYNQRLLESRGQQRLF